MNLGEAVDRGDLDELVRLIDGLCTSRDWKRVIELRDRCRQALERGLQLWPASEYAEYRLALEAPGPHAGAVVVEGAGRFALGPLWEVAASTHSWEDLGPHIPPGPARTMAAHERVLRGEDLRGDAMVDSLVLEIPAVVLPWEPDYALASYGSDEADFPAPELPALGRVEDLDATGEPVEAPGATDALLDLVRVWSDQSNGSAAAVAVSGVVVAAIGALGVAEAALTRLAPEKALAWMAWAAANGGAYGRRRGGPVGRFAAWWAVCEMAGVPWPPDPGNVKAAVAGLEWWRWSPPATGSGWEFRIAVADRDRGLAWAVEGTDSHREEDALEG